MKCHCPDCWYATNSIADLNRHFARVERFNSFDVAELFCKVLRYSDGTDIVDDDMMAVLESDQGYIYHGFTVWLRHMPDTIVVWEGNDTDYDMNKVAELPLIYS